MQLTRSVYQVVPVLLLLAVSVNSNAAQAGKDATPAPAPAQTADQKPPAKKKGFTLNVNGISVGIGTKTQKPAAPAATPSPKAAPTTSGAAPETTVAPPPQGSQGSGVGKVTFNPMATAGTQKNGSGPQAYQPPEPIMPAGEAPIWDGDIKKPITFRWTPVVPKPKDLASYRVSVWQLMQGQTAMRAFLGNKPIVEKDVDNLNMTQAAWPPDFVITSCKTPNLCSYVWSVQALDKKGRPVGGNGGIVSMAAFKYEPGETAKRGTPLIVVDGNQPAAPGIFDRWGELYAGAGEGAPENRFQPTTGSLAGNGTVTNTSNAAQLVTGGQQQKPAAPGITVLYSGTITNNPGERTVQQPTGQQKKPQPPNAGYTVNSPGVLDINGVAASGAGQKQVPQPRNDERFTATVTGQPGHPIPNDNPISAINITLPANPDAISVNWGDGSPTNQFSIEAVGPPKDARGMGRLYGGVENSRILVIIKKGGNLVCGGQTPFGAVQGGFAPESKVWSGRDAAALLGKNCSFTPGDYELDTQVVGTQGGTDVALSELAIKPFTIRGNNQRAYQPPQAILPATGTSFREAPQPQGSERLTGAGSTPAKPAAPGQGYQVAQNPTYVKDIQPAATDGGNGQVKTNGNGNGPAGITKVGQGQLSLPNPSGQMAGKPVSGGTGTPTPAELWKPISDTPIIIEHDPDAMVTQPKQTAQPGTPGAGNGPVGITKNGPGQLQRANSAAEKATGNTANWGTGTSATGNAARSTVTPSQGTPIPIEHDPDGIAVRGAANGNSNAHATVTTNSGTPVPVQPSLGGVRVAAGDINGDGKPDLTANRGNGQRPASADVVRLNCVNERCGATAQPTPGGAGPAPPENVINKGLPIINNRQSQTATQRPSGNTTAGSSGTGGVIGFLDSHALESQNGGVVSYSDAQALGVQKAVGMDNVRVLVKNGQGEMVLSGSTAANGSIALKGVKPGTYTLEIDGSSLAASEGKVGAPGGPPSILAVLLMPAENKFTKVGAGRLSVPGIGNEAVQSVTRLPYRANNAGQGMSVNFTVPGENSGGGKPAESTIRELGVVFLILTGW